MEQRQIKVCRLIHNNRPSHITIQDKADSFSTATICDASIIIASPEAVLRTYRSQLRSGSVSKRIIYVAVDEGHLTVSSSGKLYHHLLHFISWKVLKG